MDVAPNTVPPAEMARNPTTPEGESATGSIEFAQYLQKIARTEVERASDKLRADAFALVNPEKPQVHRNVSLDDVRDDLEEMEHAIRFLERAEEMERPELEGAE